MKIFKGSASTPNASRYLQQLCKHWGHKLTVEFDPSHGRIEFDPETFCTLDAIDDGLALELQAADPARAQHLTGVVTEHLKRFAFREELEVVWRDAD